MDESILEVVAQAMSVELGPRGYRWHGHSLVKRAENGDAITVRLEQTRHYEDGVVAFRPNVEAVPLPWIGWVRGERDAAALRGAMPADDDAMVRERPIGKTLYEDWEVSSPAAAEAVAAEVIAAADPLLARFEQLLDRAEFLRQVRAHRSQRLRGLRPSHRVAEFVLMVDGPPCHELTERKLDLLEEASNGEEWAAALLEWAEGYRRSLGLTL